MEHSLLHALKLCGLLVALGGALFVLGVLRVASRGLAPSGELMENIREASRRWAFRGALVSALAAGLDIFVQVAEVQGRAVYGGVEWALVIKFATQTAVGRLSVSYALVLLAAAAACRFRARGNWWIVGALGLAGSVLASLVSHAAAQPAGRGPAVAWQIFHVMAGAGWIGILCHLLASRRVLCNADDPAAVSLTREVVRRFSPVALTASSLLLASGLVASVRNLPALASLFTSPYGLTLLVKLMLLAIVVCAGWMNFRRVRPALLAAGAIVTEKSRAALARFSKLLELEVTAGLLVITLAGVLGSVSPPGPDGAAQLTAEQARAVFTPDWPTTVLVDTAFAGQPTRTVDDLRYSEFMHNWSGVIVVLLGGLWLLQANGGRAGWWAGRLWPMMLVPFGIFISVFADVEIFVLRTVSVRQVLGDPILLEHQLGALLVFVLAWLGWREVRRPGGEERLGYAMSVVMVSGSLLLLGHAHSGVTSNEALTNLINVQHAFFGMFGLFAGAVRWFGLRGLIPASVTRRVWPACVIALGVFMAFFYREII